MHTDLYSTLYTYSIRDWQYTVYSTDNYSTMISSQSLNKMYCITVLYSVYCTIEYRLRFRLVLLTVCKIQMRRVTNRTVRSRHGILYSTTCNTVCRTTNAANLCTGSVLYNSNKYSRSIPMKTTWQLDWRLLALGRRYLLTPQVTQLKLCTVCMHVKVSRSRNISQHETWVNYIGKLN